MQHIYDQPQFGEEWFTYKDFYKEIVDKFPCGSKFIEIGCWKGKSSAYMAVEIANSRKRIEFTCIDTWKGNKENQNAPELNRLYEIFKDNMRSLENYYSDLRMPSLQAAKLFEDDSLDFVFIDGSHEYVDVKNDINAWLPKVKMGGILAGHDYWKDTNAWPDVKRAVRDLLSDYKVIKEGCWIHEVKFKLTEFKNIII